MSRISMAQLKELREVFQRNLRYHSDGLRDVKNQLKVIDELMKWKEKEEGDVKK